MKLSRLLGATALAGSLMFVPAVAFAQDEPQSEATTEEGDGPIVVTGSRIVLPNLESTVPIHSVSGEEFFDTGQVSIGDVLNELPQLRNTFSQQNSTRFLGTRGLNLLDLRGLGTQRTLVLVNGRRHVGGDVLSNAVSPDVNTIPTDLIERVDVLTGGNSSIYGSDAIAGVVNFVLKDKFDGIQLRGQAGINVDYKDAGNQYVSLLAGKNFADGRGNIAVNIEYAHQSDFYASGRPNLRQNDAFVIVDTDLTSNGDDTPDRIFFRDIRSSTISSGGLTAIYQGSTTAISTGACGRDGLGAAFTCTSLFTPSGALIGQTGTRVGIGPNGSFIGGNGQTNREGRLTALSPDLERISVNALGHFEFSPAFVPFFEAKYVRTTAIGSQSGPFFTQGTTLGDGPTNRERVRLDNPYLTAQARASLTTQLLAAANAGINPNATSGSGAFAATATQTAAEVQAATIAAINAGTYRFTLRKNWVEFGTRDERIRRETWRGVVGIRGDFNDDWHYEISANYGQHDETNVILGNINIQRFLLALDSGVDPLNPGAGVQCRAKFNPAARQGYIDEGAIFAADIAACTPINPFGQNASSQAARDYITMDTVAHGKISQFVASAYVSGDSSQWFELPGGPVGFSIGGEYRVEDTSYDLDPLTQAGYAFYNAIPSFEAPAFKVKELYGELSVPLLKDTPFFHSLSLSASGRVADYNLGTTGTVFAWSVGGEWAPIRDIRFRGSYSKSIRAPNLVDLYSVPGQNFAPAFNDPCSARNINTGSSTRAANCAAAGRPAGYDFVYQQSLEIVSGGNPALKEEKGTSFTVGAIFEPRFVPGLSVSVDYYDLTVDNVITAPTAQQIVNGCYDLADLNNQFCALFQRAPAGGAATGEEQFRIIEGSLQQITLNYAKLKVRGIDTNVSYRHNFDWGKVQVSGVWTHTLVNDSFTNPADPARINRILGELADPSDEINLKTAVTLGKVTLGYELHWIDKMYLNTYEDFNSLQGRPAENPDYAGIQKYPSVFYHDVRLDMNVTDKFNFYIGVDNVTNRKPPYGLTGVGAGSGIYDNRGRYGYVGFKANF